MYRIRKILNHNAIIAVFIDDHKEYILLGKGIGFGKKVSERIEPTDECRIYSMQEETSKGDARTLARAIPPEYMEYASRILDEAEKRIGPVDRGVMLPMADHIAFAVQRLLKGEAIDNPLTTDIKILFQPEYQIAEMIRDILKQEKQIDIPDDEIGYVALHIHSATDKIKASVSMQMAEAARRCVDIIEQRKNCKIDLGSLSYNRLMNHVKYMVVRIVKGEYLKLNMNDYMEIKYPESFILATQICDELSCDLKLKVEEIEIGYLAMHIERIFGDGES